MSFNPFKERGVPIEKQFRNWSELNVKPYDKEKAHPYSRCRGIVMNGIEVEAVMFSHQMARHTADPKIKQQLALVRRAEAQQQKAINWLTPGEETTLELTIGYEQVAVDLTAWVARHEPDAYLKQCYEFGLLEDFDHLFRFANLMLMLEETKAEKIVGKLTEITPGRPTIFEHRDPRDEIRRPMTAPAADPQSLLNALTVLAAEQQTMNFYNTIGNRPLEPLARGLYLEIAQIEEQHVTHYESMLDPTATWTTNLVLHEYNECWLYWSFMGQEPDRRVRQLYELHLNMELEHLRLAAEMMRAIERRDPEDLLPAFAEPMIFEDNKEYVRQVLESQVDLTAQEDKFVPIGKLKGDHRYFKYQEIVNKGGIPSEEVIEQAREALGEEYRLETEGPNPVPGLQREAERGGAVTGYAEKVAA